MLGQPVTRCLVAGGYNVRVLARNQKYAHEVFGNMVEIIKGNAKNKADIQAAIEGCDAVHINLTHEVELVATQTIVDLSVSTGLERITYVSATTACEENRWFEMADLKMRCEAILRDCGIPAVVFCPTWALETLNNFIQGDRAAIIIGRNPPALHFFASADFGRMVAASYKDNRAFGKRLFVHGPEAITLPAALERFISTCHPQLKVVRMKLWQAQLFAQLTGRERLKDATQLISYFDKVGELGDPNEANILYGAPTITLEEWCKISKESHAGLPN